MSANLDDYKGYAVRVESSGEFKAWKKAEEGYLDNVVAVDPTLAVIVPLRSGSVFSSGSSSGSSSVVLRMVIFVSGVVVSLSILGVASFMLPGGETTAGNSPISSSCPHSSHLQ